MIFTPLVWVIQQSSRRSAWWYGIVWGCLTYTVQFLPVILFIHHHITQWIGWLVPLLAIGLCTLSAGLWFVGMWYAYQLGIRWFSLVGMGIVTLLFFTWIHTGLFLPFIGGWYGYPFSLPILSLMSCTSMQWLLVHVGISLTLFLYVMISMAIGVGIVRKRVMPTLLLIATIMLFLGIHISSEHISNGSIVPCQIPKDINTSVGLPYERIMAICQIVEATQRQYPDASVLVLPESIFPYSDSSLHELLAQHLAGICKDTVTVLLGTYRKEGVGKDQKRYNCAALINKRRIIQYYDKQLLIPFFEYVPSFWSDILFSINGSDFKSGPASASVHIAGHTAAIKICSEVFWDFGKGDEVIIALVNDQHFRGTFLVDLMKIWAECQASSLHKKLVYAQW